MNNVIDSNNRLKVYYRSGENEVYYRMGNIGWWLRSQRQQAGLTRTQVADRMHWPHGAITQLEKGARIPYAKTVYKYIAALQGEKVEFGDMYSRFHKTLPNSVGVKEIREWLESLPGDTVVQTAEGTPSESCVVTHYGRMELGMPKGTSNYRTLYNDDVDNFYRIRIERQLASIMGEYFDDNQDRTLTAKDALEFLDNA